MAFKAHHFGCLEIADNKDHFVLHITDLIICAKAGSDLPRSTLLADIDLLAEQLVGLGVVPNLRNLSDTNVNLCEIRLVTTGLLALGILGGLLLLLTPLSFCIIFIFLLLDIRGTKLLVRHDLRRRGSIGCRYILLQGRM